MSVPQVTVRQLPLPRCAYHKQWGKYVVDGTDEWLCRDCMAMLMRAAEVQLGPERRLHQYHQRPNAHCPFCNPGMAA